MLQDALGQCPCCRAYVSSLPKLILHIAAHILYDAMIDRKQEPCGLCLQPSLACLFYFKCLHSAIQINTEKSTCPQLSSRFLYARAKSVTEESPCGNVPGPCPRCPKNAPRVWKYNLQYHFSAKHCGSPVPADLQITQLEIDTLSMHWDNQCSLRQKPSQCKSKKKAKLASLMCTV